MSRDFTGKLRTLIMYNHKCSSSWRRLSTLATRQLKSNLNSPLPKEHVFPSSGQLPKWEYIGPKATPSMTIYSHHVDTSIWNHFISDDNDIYIVTPGRSGTTVCQEIVANLVYNCDYYNEVGIKHLSEISPWIEWRLENRLADCVDETDETAMKRRLYSINNQLKCINPQSKIKRRIIKLHLPIETIRYNSRCKYIFCARDYIDVTFSYARMFDVFARQDIADILNKDYKGFDCDKQFTMKELNEMFGNSNGHGGNCNISIKNFWDLNTYYESPAGIKTSEYVHVNNNNSDDDDDELIHLPIGGFSQREDLIRSQERHPDGCPRISQMATVGSWYNAKYKHKCDNILVLHFNQFRENFKDTVTQIARFIDNGDENDDNGSSMVLNDEFINRVVDKCTINSMKQRKCGFDSPDASYSHDQKAERDRGAKFYGNASKYDWKHILTQDDLLKYKMVARRYLDDEAIYWMENGKFPDAA